MAEFNRSKELVIRRSEYGCEMVSFSGERCFRTAYHFHHIKPRSKGRDDSFENLMHLCFECHRWIHDNPELARKLGVLK